MLTACEILSNAELDRVTSDYEAVPGVVAAALIGLYPGHWVASTHW